MIPLSRCVKKERRGALRWDTDYKGTARTVAVMHIPVEDEDTTRPCRLRCTRRDAGVVVEAEAHAHAALRMMPRGSAPGQNTSEVQRHSETHELMLAITGASVHIQTNFVCSFAGRRRCTTEAGILETAGRWPLDTLSPSTVSTDVVKHTQRQSAGHHGASSWARRAHRTIAAPERASPR